MNSTGKTITATFEKYQKDRLAFAQSLSDLSSRDANIDTLIKSGALPLLKPLLLDNVPPIQQAAANALSKIANFNEDAANLVVGMDIIPHLTFKFAEQNKFFKKASASALRAIARHSQNLAWQVVNNGGLSALMNCAFDVDSSLKEAGIWGLGYIARHSTELAKKVADRSLIPVIIKCCTENDPAIRKVALSALSDICKHTAELAQSIIDYDVIGTAVGLINDPDVRVRKQTITLLSQIAKHNVELAENVVDAEIFPAILVSIKDVDPAVRKSAVILICEISKHTAELAQLIVNAGGVAPIVDYLNETTGSAAIPALMCLGYISAYSETLALSVIMAKGVTPMISLLAKTDDQNVKASCVWVLGQIGRHSAEHAKAVSDQGGFAYLLKTYQSLDEDESEDESGIKAKTKRALKSIIEKTLSFEALEPLMNSNCPAPILKSVVQQFSKILPHDVTMRRQFVTSGALQRLQEISAQFKRSMETSTINLDEHVAIINKCFPDEVIMYYSPGYSDVLLKKIDTFTMKDEQESGKDTEEAKEPTKDAEPQAMEPQNASA